MKLQTNIKAGDVADWQGTYGECASQPSIGSCKQCCRGHLDMYHNGEEPYQGFCNDVCQGFGHK